MSFVLQTPSLQHLAGVKIVAHLWSRGDILTQIKRSIKARVIYRLKEEREEWMAIDENVQGKIWALPLPAACQKQLCNLIIALGMEIGMWCRYHTKRLSNYQFSENLLPQQLRWTMHGIVDYAKTAELMVKNKRLSIERRYEVACLNCLEDEARELIRFIPEERRQELINAATYDDEGLIIDHNFLIVYFTCVLNGKPELLNSYFQGVLRRDQSIYKCVFDVALRSGSAATCDYFFKRLNQREKEQVLGDLKRLCFRRRRRAPTCGLMYCLLLMNEEERRSRLFHTDVYDALLCFLFWPMQPLFMATAERGWRFLSQSSYDVVLVWIAIRIRLAYKDYDYCRLFWACWRMCSVEYKQYYLRNSYFLVVLIRTKEEEFLRLIFNEGDLDHVIASFNKYHEIRQIFMDESAISEAALMECKEKATLESSNHPHDAGKRLRSERLNQLVDMVMESREK